MVAIVVTGRYPRAIFECSTDHCPPTGFRDGLAASGSWSLHVREVGHGGGGCVTRCTSMISRPRPTIRSTSPERAAWSGNSARRVVVSGRVVTWQSSNCARSVLPAWPLKVISYVGDRTGIMPRNWWLTLAIRVPDGGVRVVTRYWVIRSDAMAAAGSRRAVGTSEARQPAPAARLPSGGLLSALHRAYAGQDRACLRRSCCAGHLQWASLDELMTWRACALDAAGGRSRTVAS